MSRDELFFLDLGLLDYRECHAKMLRLVEQRIAQEVGDTVILVEHPHVYTLGRKGREENVLDKSVPVYRVERGGDATYHGPGQLVAYPVIDLNKLDVTVAGFVHLLEDVLIKVLHDFSIEAERVEGYPGVWVRGKKIASIGLAVKQWVTYHGIALNVNTDLSKFMGIRPCGMDSEIMTSMEKILGQKVDMTTVKRSLVKHLSQTLRRNPVYVTAAVADTATLFKSL
ncbi:MAG: lipoyl(octanoyl) transferase LipB [Candidatus Caldarchaeum sp.]|jgi:lipoate-protein ligase B